MTKRKMVLILLLYFSLGGLIRMMLFQSCILANDYVSSQEISEEQRKIELKRKLQELKRQEELKKEEERSRKNQILRRKIAKLHPEMAQKRKQQWLQGDQKWQEFKKDEEEAGGRRFLFAKYALRVSEEQWNLIRPKLEKVINLWDKANSTVGVSLSFDSSSGQKVASVPKLQWDRPWRFTPLFEMTEAQRLTKQLRILLEKKDTSPEVFRLKVAALRKARSKEAEIQKDLAEARRELREILTTRQEAVLVLLGWL